MSPSMRGRGGESTRVDRPGEDPGLDPLVEFGGLALDAVHHSSAELRRERAVSRFLAETLATGGPWGTERWLDEAAAAVDGLGADDGPG